MEYIIAIYDSEGNRYKLCHKRKGIEYAENLYNKLISTNVVHFPRRTINKKHHLKELKFYLYLLKEKEGGDENRIIRDSLGKLVKEKFKDEQYSVLKKEEFFIEEKFSVYGYNQKLTFKEIVKNFLLNSDRIKYIFYFLNKLIVEDYDGINIVICKTSKDARRLHDKLIEFSKSNKLNKGVFMNYLKPENRKRIYQEIKDKTKWSWTRIYRNSTRT